jgi:hypothetical protein
MIEQGLSLLSAALVAYTAQVGGGAAASPRNPAPVQHHSNPRWQEQAVTYRCDGGTRRFVTKEIFNVEARFVSATRSGRKVSADQLRKVAQSLRGFLFWQIKPMCQAEGDLLIISGARGPERVQVMLLWSDTLFEVRQVDVLK